VIQHDLMGSAIFAASLLLGRALQPIEQLVGHGAAWCRCAARPGAWVSSWARRVIGAFRRVAAAGRPAQSRRADLDRARYNAAALARHFVRARAREVLGVIGPSGAGKSTLVRHLSES